MPVSGGVGRPSPATDLPSSLRSYLDVEALRPVWLLLRARLERTGHAVRGTVELEIGDDAADRLAGVLGRPVLVGRLRLPLTELDAALRRSSAARGVVPVVAALTGSPLRDRPAERDAAATYRRDLWQHVDTVLVAVGLADRSWVPPWIAWLHEGGVLTRLGPGAAREAVSAAGGVLAELLPAAAPDVPASQGPVTRPLGELATRWTGTAHGLDDGRPAPALVLRALALAYDVGVAASASERRELWLRAGVTTDTVSGTVITWALRPPGQDQWSVMMRARADLGLVTHLTGPELAGAPPLIEPGQVVFGCENPQVLQAAADEGIRTPMVCPSGNPSAAGALLLTRVPVRYHGDFDWPGIAIARRIFALGAKPWRMEAADYLAGLETLGSDRLPLSGRPEPTPWSPDLRDAMIVRDVAVHEEGLLRVLLADLRPQ